MTFTTLENSETTLLNLKSELAKVDAVLKSSEYIKREQVYNLKLDIAVKKEVAEKGYTTIQNIESPEVLHICDLYDEIEELENTLTH